MLCEPVGTAASATVAVPNRVILAPMSGVTDAPFRRLVSRLGRRPGGLRNDRLRAAGPGPARCRAARRRAGRRHPCRAARRLRGALDGGGRAHRARTPAPQIIDINMGCPAKHVTNGQSGSALMRDLDHALTLIEATVAAVARAGDAEDAARLGRRQHQCAGACAPRRSGGRAADHRARPHPLPVLQGQRRLGGGARREGSGLDSGRRQRRHQELRRRRRGARGLRRRRRHDRPRRAGPAVVSGPDRALSRDRRARAKRRRSRRSSR